MESVYELTSGLLVCVDSSVYTTTSETCRIFAVEEKHSNVIQKKAHLVE